MLESSKDVYNQTFAKEKPQLKDMQQVNVNLKALNQMVKSKLHNLVKEVDFDDESEKQTDLNCFELYKTVFDKKVLNWCTN